MESMSDAAIIERLTQVRGIGSWSAQMLLMFYLGRPNVLPVADLGVQKGFAITYGRRELPSAKSSSKRRAPGRPTPRWQAGTCGERSRSIAIGEPY
jgi:3-methyladenine DNA glycosylase/8-oxoguanine DNA glycosylase